jgi:hypothetical protein
VSYKVGLSNTPYQFLSLWPENKYWFSMVLEGQKFAGYFLFEGHDKILKYTLEHMDF